jgi:hypothetical protein
MSNTRWPLDVANLTIRTVGGPAGDPRPVRDFNTGEPRTDKATGLPLYEVRLSVSSEHLDETITVRLAGEPADVRRYMPVKVTGLTVQPWQLKNGKSGISFRAERIEPAAVRKTA